MAQDRQAQQVSCHARVIETRHLGLDGIVEAVAHADGHVGRREGGIRIHHVEAVVLELVQGRNVAADIFLAESDRHRDSLGVLAVEGLSTAAVAIGGLSRQITHRGRRVVVLLIVAVEPNREAARREIERRVEALGGFRTQGAAVRGGIFRALDVIEGGEASVQEALHQRSLQGDGIIRGTAVRLRGAHFAPEFVGRRLGDEIDRAAEGVAAEVGVLRTFQHFDVIDVDEIHRGLAAGDEDAVDEQ